MNTPSDDEFVEISLSPPPEEAEAAANEEGEENSEGEAAKEEEKGEEGADAEHEGSEGEEGGEGDDEPLSEERKPAKGAEARIAELTRLRRQAERERDAAIAQLQGARDPAKAATPKPTPDDYEDYGEYVEALTDWKADERETQRADTAATTAATDAANARNTEWGAKVAAITESLPDYAEVAGKSEIEIRDFVVDAIMDADRGPELVYHLAQNPDVAARLNDMSPARAAIELGKIEATLGEPAAPAEAAPPAKKTTTAPAPITPVKPGATTSKDPAKMGQAEYNEWRKGQLGR